MTKDTKKYWFKPKRWGWGWGLPCTWQGWAVFAAYFIALMAGGTFILKDAPEDEFSIELVYFIGYVSLLAFALIYIGYKKGPKPEWRWGDKKTKDKK